jgi:polysaccharide biosynthesis/export protein
MRIAAASLLLLILGGCSILPNDGPAASAVPHEAARATRYAFVDLDYAATQQIAAHPPKPFESLTGRSSQAPNDRIAAGDVLGISVIELGPGLFGSSAGAGAGAAGGGSEVHSLGATPVDESGDILVPFAGLIHVAGLTPHEASGVLRAALLKRTVDPQVSVTVMESKANSVSVIGEVRNTGRFLLSPNNDRLLDALTTAGGPTKQPADLSVVVSRGASTATIQLAQLLADPTQNIRLAPRDQVRVLDAPRKYSTFGAFHGLVAQTPIQDDNVTLAGAISRAGGLDTMSADPSAVMVFRFERPEVAQALGVHLPPAAKGVPIVYRLNFREPDRLFVANNFDVRADDMIYVPRSNFAEAQKFLAIVNSVTQIGYNVTQFSRIP